MSFFDKFRKGKEESPQTERRFENALLEIVRIVSFDDEEVIQTARECIDHTEAYYQDHETEYEERGLSGEEEETFLQWIGCIDLLIRHRYVCECDWEEEKEAFLAGMTTLRGIDALSLKINEAWLDEEQDVSKWCEVLDEKWQKRNGVAAAFDIDSDSYVIFVCKKADFAVLSDLADEFGYRIDAAKNM